MPLRSPSTRRPLGALGGVAVVVAALHVPADAAERGRAPARGSVRRVVKRGAAAVERVYWVEWGSFGSGSSGVPAELSIGTVTAELDPGDEFDVVDALGWVGRVQVQDVDIEVLRCPGAELKRGRARFLQPATRAPTAPVVALGPASRGLARARVVPAEEAKGTLPPQPPALMDRVLVDLDADAVPDLSRSYSYCEGRGSSGSFCFELWARSGDRWRRVQETRLDNCF